MEKDLAEAVMNDLNVSEFRPVTLELVPIRSEIKHTIQNLKNWMKPNCVDTSMLCGPAKSY